MRILKVVTSYSEQVLIIKTEYFKSKVTPTIDFLQPCQFQLHQSSNFFSMGDNSKILFFLPKGFHILATRKNNFHGPGGPNGSLGPYWLILGLKRAIFELFP